MKFQMLFAKILKKFAPINSTIEDNIAAVNIRLQQKATLMMASTTLCKYFINFYPISLSIYVLGDFGSD